jgi:hypothetical protein
MWERGHTEHLGLDSIISYHIQMYRKEWRGLDYSGWGQGAVTCCCESGNTHSCVLKFRELLEWFTGYGFFKNESAQRG